MKIGRFARWYRWIEYAAFGRALERQRFAHLDRLSGRRRILILGEGDGRALERLLAVAPEARIDVVDVSPEMIGLARHRNRDPDRVAFFCRDARTTDWPSGDYDAIVTQFFLDCFGEAEARELIGRLARAMVPNGVWLISEFTIPARGWQRLHARLWVHAMYRFFGFVTGLQTRSLPPIETLMQDAGLTCHEQQIRRAGMITSEVWKHEH